MLKYTIPRIINGCWQIASGHSNQQVLQTNLNELFFNYISSELNVFDCADIYTGVEKCLGKFKKYAEKNDNKIYIHTKFVPDLENLDSLSPAHIQEIITRSCNRLQSVSLDLVQFHWWRYDTGNYLKALDTLMELKTKGIINNIGLTNFNTKHLNKIIDHKIEIATIQVQYSLLDRRPEKQMMQYAKSHNIKILSYGTLAGGFLTDKWLGKKNPDISDLANRSLIKYKLIIDEFGGWAKFQDLLATLYVIAKNYAITVEELVVIYMLNHTPIDAIILGISNRFNNKIISLLDKIKLSDKDCQQIAIKSAQIIDGDVYDLERDLSGPHAGIMRYNLQRLAP